MSTINTKALYKAKGELIDAGIILNRSKEIKQIYLDSINSSQTILYKSTESLNTDNMDVQYSRTKSDTNIDIELKETVNQNVVGNIQVPRTLYVSSGKDGQNKMIWSYDGQKQWNGSSSVFDSNAYSVASNGSLWIASGEGTQNTLAYSYDGYLWNGLGKSIFTEKAVNVAYYNKIWVAVGQSANSIAYSINGFEWTGLGMRFSNAGLCLKHNGSLWLAGGDSIGNSFAYSSDGITWSTVDCGLKVVRDIAYSDSIIIAVGDKTDTTWELVSNTMTDWNGSFEDDDLTSYLSGSEYFKKLDHDGPTTLTGWTFTKGAHPDFGPTIFRGSTYNSGDTVLRGQQLIGLRYEQKISKTITGLTMGKVYKLSWERHIRQDDQPEYNITLDSDSNVIFNETPTGPIGASTSAERYKEVIFEATSTIHTITFNHLVNADKTVYIDNVELYEDLESRKNMAYSQDSGLTWTSMLISNLENINGIAKNNDIWVALGKPETSSPEYSMMYSQDVLGIDNWTDISNSLLSTNGQKVMWNGQKFIAVGQGDTNTILISDDGIEWTGKGPSVLTSGANHVSYDGTKLIVGGSLDASGNTMSYSLDDGSNWYPLNSSTSIFTTQANDIGYNGIHWLALGEGLTNTMAISKDGKLWKGLGNHTFSVRGNSVYYDERTKKWVAMGEGTNTMAYSYNSYIWTGLGTSIFSVKGSKVLSNGNIWVAVGEGVDHTLAYSYDGISWVGLGKSVFSVRGNDVVWSGIKWNVVGEGTNSMAYSYDGINWETNITNDILTNKVNTIGYFNNMWVAGGDGVSGTKLSSNLNPEGSWNILGTAFEAERGGDQLGNSVSLSGNGSVLAIASSYHDPPIGGVEPEVPRSIETIAGTGVTGYSGDGGLATEAQVAFNIRAFKIYNGQFYFADFGNCRIRKIDLSTNIITTVAGTGVTSYSGDGGLAIDAGISRVQGFGVDNYGNMFLSANQSGASYKMRKIDVNTGIISLYAGDGTAGNSGDGGLPLDARIGLAYQIEFDSQNNMYFTSYEHGYVRRIDYQTQIVSTIMTGISVCTDLAIDVNDNVYEIGWDHKARKWDKTTNEVTIIAGAGKSNNSAVGQQDPAIGDGGLATDALLNYPQGIAVATNGDVYISDTYNNRVRKIDAITNIITTVIGDGYGSIPSGTNLGENTGDGGDPSEARIKKPMNIDFDDDGRLYIMTEGKIRRAYLPSTHITNAGHVRVYQQSSGSWSQIGSDIDGIVENDFTGTSLSLSSDGTTVAVGVIGHSGTGLTGNGCVRVYKNQSGNWTKIGSDIEGDNTNDNFGTSVAISQDGSIVVIGAANYQGGNNGYAKVYQNQSGSWTQIGSTIVGDSSTDRLGNSVSISLDGTIIAIGVKEHNSGRGQVKIYQNNANVWTQLGNSILGTNSDDNLGYSVSLSGNGQIIAIGAHNGDINQTNSGHVSVYQYVSGTTSWDKLGNDMVGYESNGQFGNAVALSSDGSTVIVGSSNSDASGTDSGLVKVFKHIDGYWLQVGRKVVGQNSGDKFGFSVTINTDGSIIGVGATGFENNDGSVSAYQIQNAYIDGEVGIGHTLAYSTDGINWTGLNADTFSAEVNTVDHNGLYWVAGGKGSNTMAYSINGTKWVSIKENAFTDVCTGIKSNKNTPQIILKGDILAFGQGTNTIAKSTDGVTWTGEGKNVFTEYAKNGFWNGKMWVAVGKGTNTLATSLNGNTWNGLGTSVFTTQGNDVVYGGNKWVAVGGGLNKFAYSLDGINWTSVENTVFVSQGNKLAYNGELWVAVGKGGNTIATSTDGINWTGRGKTIFTLEGNGVVWTGSKWVATGSGGNTIAYSSDGINWTGLGVSVFALQGNGLAYNGELIVATGKGSNTIASSIDGVQWTPQGQEIFNGEAKNIDWNGSKWLASGVGSNTLAYSINGFSWTGLGNSIFTNTAYAISSNNPLLYDKFSDQIYQKQILLSTDSSFKGDVSIKIEK